MSPLKIVTINTRGLNDPVKCQSVFNFLCRGGGDIFLIQECSIAFKENYKLFENRWTYGQSVWSGDNKNRASGLAVLFNNRQLHIQRVERVIDGRLMLVDIEGRGTRFRVINAYCPTETQDRQMVLQTIQTLVYCGREVIIGGDLNCIVDIADRRSTSFVQLDVSSHILQNIIKDCKLIDVYRQINPSTPGYTWNNGKSFSRIDFLFTTLGITPLTSTVEPVPFSDHHKLDCTVEIHGSIRSGQGPWKLNTSLLDNPQVVSKYRGKLNQWFTLQPLFESLGEWWEDVKHKTRAFFIAEGKKAAAKKRALQKRLQAKLQRYYLMSLSGFDVNEDIVKLKKDMSKLYNEKSRGVLTRSRVQHLEENEKCTRYFFKKLGKARHCIEAVLDKDRKEVRGSQDILEVVKSFYSDLYQEKSISEQSMSYFLSHLTTKLNNTDRDLLERDLTINEITKAMQSMQSNRTPGLDGLPKEFYSTFWDQLKEPLLHVFKESFSKGILPPSLRTGSISLLLKKGDRKDLRNWRPLTLLGVDIKILSKALFFRMQPVIDELVGEDQTCGVRGRSMTDSLALVRDSYLYAQDRHLPLCLLGLDLEKAFDSISHQYFQAVLSQLNFGTKFRTWVDLLYSDISSTVLVNGNCSAPFRVKSGVRQGCPLSPTLFILAIEPLACALRHSKTIRGLPIPGATGKEAKLSLYMDDLTLLLTDNKSITDTLLICDEFTFASGTKINKEKSEILCLNWREPVEHLGLAQKNETIKVLGVQIGKNMEKNNWESKLPKIRGKLLQWQDRDLTMTGKVLVLKAEILASLTHLAATFPIPHGFLASLKKIIFQFMWGGQHEKLKREIMFRPLEKGGKGVPDMEGKLKAMFVTPIINACLKPQLGPSWAFFAMFWVGRSVLRAWGKRPSQNRPYAQTWPKMYDVVLSCLGKCAFQPRPDKLTRADMEQILSPQHSRLTPVGTLTEEHSTTVWSNVSNPLLLNKHKDLAWQIVHQCLPTRAFLERRGCTRSAKCPRPSCGDSETVQHLFWSCPTATSVWSLVLPWLQALYRSPQCYEDIAYGCLKRNPTDEMEKWWVVINCVKESLWKARNVQVSRKYGMPQELVVRCMLNIFSDYLLQDMSTKQKRNKILLWKIPEIPLFENV